MPCMNRTHQLQVFIILFKFEFCFCFFTKVQYLASLKIFLAFLVLKAKWGNWMIFGICPTEKILHRKRLEGPGGTGNGTYGKNFCEFGLKFLKERQSTKRSKVLHLSQFCGNKTLCSDLSQTIPSTICCKQSNHGISTYAKKFRYMNICKFIYKLFSANKSCQRASPSTTPAPDSASSPSSCYSSST